MNFLKSGNKPKENEEFQHLLTNVLRLPPVLFACLFVCLYLCGSGYYLLIKREHNASQTAEYSINNNIETFRATYVGGYNYVPNN